MNKSLKVLSTLTLALCLMSCALKEPVSNSSLNNKDDSATLTSSEGSNKEEKPNESSSEETNKDPEDPNKDPEGPNNDETKEKTISVWVDREEKEFFEKESKVFLAENKDFDFNIKFIEGSVGEIQGFMESDNTSCPDIVTLAHDNVIKFASLDLLIPLKDKGLIAQINNETTSSYLPYTLASNSNGVEATYFSPTKSNSLLLYYNKNYVNDTQAMSFEGLLNAARETNRKCLYLRGRDSYNFGFLRLAKRASDNYTSLKLYENGEMDNNFYQGNDALAITRYGQRLFNDPNGAYIPNGFGFFEPLKEGTFISAIAGSWDYQALIDAIGANNLGVAKIPSFTLTEEDVKGLSANEFDPNVPKAGDVYNGGVFSDFLGFTINSAIKETKIDAANKLIKYLSCKDMQKKKYQELGIPPSFKVSNAYLDSLENSKDSTLSIKQEVAKAILEEAQYCSPSPVINARQNVHYYSSGADILYNEMILKDVLNPSFDYDTLKGIRECHYAIEYIWANQSKPKEIPSVLPAKIVASQSY